ncbi:Arachidonate 12-lipoxygenase, 12R-type [Chelonia mydas]|uniref:Arachidonate 12-lipoxygenase, 12R-type n=1 Tax=Chelonia mydas TaxID=8469 RepID=M7BC16_CHEMY|nr:Arachidonate 12-lipoxygenase, 12R-type [Chelonia mydas]
MGVYKVRVATGNFLLAGTFSSISITLVGTHEESDKKPLDNYGKDFNPGAVSTSQTVCDDADSPWLLEQRQAELKHRRECYGWKEYAPGLPRCLAVESIIELDCNTMYSFTKSTNFLLRGGNAPPLRSDPPHAGPVSPESRPSALTPRLWDWTLAKTWVRYAEFLVHEAVSHLLLTHLIGEPFALATLRQLPLCHPVFKTAAVFHSNPPPGPVARRLKALSLVPSQGLGSGLEGTKVLMAKGMSCLTYASLCFPDDIQERGVDCIPNYYYRDDGLKIWSAIESPGCPGLLAEPDLPCAGAPGRGEEGIPGWAWGGSWLGRGDWLGCGGPGCSDCGGLSGLQYDLGAWMPNFPATMRNPPPQAKGTTSLESYLDTIPEVNSTSLAIYILWVLCCEPGDSVRTRVPGGAVGQGMGRGLSRGCSPPAGRAGSRAALGGARRWVSVE